MHLPMRLQCKIVAAQGEVYAIPPEIHRATARHQVQLHASARRL